MNHNAMCLKSRLFDSHSSRADKPARRAASPASRKQRSVPGAVLTAVTMVGAVLATAAMLAGCANPAGAVAPSHSLMTPAQVGASASASSTPWPASDWWRGWGDPQLSGLIDQALVQQPAPRFGGCGRVCRPPLGGPLECSKTVSQRDGQTAQHRGVGAQRVEHDKRTVALAVS